MTSSSPIQEVIAMILRRTRVQDTSYLINLNEWIPEAMSLLKTKFVMVNKYADVVINFHKGTLPNDIDHIEAVEHNGRRLVKGNSSISPGSSSHMDGRGMKGSERGTTNGFEFLPQVYTAPQQPNPQENSHFFTQDLTPMRKNEHHSENWY